MAHYSILTGQSNRTLATIIDGSAVAIWNVAEAMAHDEAHQSEDDFDRLRELHDELCRIADRLRART